VKDPNRLGPLQFQDPLIFMQGTNRLAANVALLVSSVLDKKVKPAQKEARRLNVQRWHPHDFAFKSSKRYPNPFLVPFSATLTSPKGKTYTLGGFYDGRGTWKVRVRPDIEGEWTLRTTSTDKELNGKSLSFWCSPNVDPAVHGGLRVDKAHPYPFVYEDGSRYFLLGYECDWLWALDMKDPKLPALKPFLSKLERFGFNHILLNTYAYDVPWQIGNTGPDDYGPPPMRPWHGSNDKPDYTRFNLRYWQHYDRMMQTLLEHGIVAHIMLRVYNKQVHWPPNKSPEDDIFYRWVIARYAAFPNVVWDFSKEAFYEKDLDYKRYRVEFIRHHDPYHNLITSHDDSHYGVGDYAVLLDFRTDQQHGLWHETILKQRLEHLWPVVNAEFGYEQGPKGPKDHTYSSVQAPEEIARRAWQVCMAGGYPVYYYTYTAWDVIRPEDTPTGYTYMHNLKSFFEGTHYWELSPRDDLVSAGYCLAAPGKEYVASQEQAAPVELALEALPAKPQGNAQAAPKQVIFTAKWYDPLAGKYYPAEKNRTPARHHLPPHLHPSSYLAGQAGGAARVFSRRMIQSKRRW